MNDHIIELQAENFKRLKAITIRPKGSMVPIGGRNAQGKSSTIDAVIAALGGGRACPEDPIRHGEKKAQVRVELENLIVTRKFTKSGTKLEVVAKDGSPIKKPQQVLDELVGSLSFDPLAFCRMSVKDQANTLRKLAGLDLNEIDTEIDTLFSRRKLENKEAKKLRGAADAHQYNKGLPVELVSVSDLVTELRRRQENNDARAKIVADKRTNEAAIRELCSQQESIAREIRRLDDLKAAKEKELKEAQANVDERNAYTETLDKRYAMTHAENIDEVQAQIDSAEETNAAIRENNLKIEKDKAAKAAEDAAEATTAELAQAREKRMAMIEAADFPVDGLSIDEDGVAFQGVSFSQASGAEQIRVSAAIGLAMNPTLKVLFIKEGALLDDDSMAALTELATENQAQVWIETVGDPGEFGVIIEDGEVQNG